MDAIFELAARAYDTPWREVRPEHGKPGTPAETLVSAFSRFFRRLTHRGLWHRLLKELAGNDLSPAHPLRQIEWFVCKAARRAARLGGLRLLFLIRRLGLHMALNAPSWLLPDRLLSELVRRLPALPPDVDPRRPWRRGTKARALRWIARLKHLHRMAGGRSRIPRPVRLSW